VAPDRTATLSPSPRYVRTIVIVDPRRTTVAVCEAETGKDRVLHLAIESGTDLALFNAVLTHIAERGWQDKAFIGASTKDHAGVASSTASSAKASASHTRAVCQHRRAGPAPPA
jgi:arsenite oxidase large subunit